jgi:hypothetical protein
MSVAEIFDPGFLSTEQRFRTSREAVDDYCRLAGVPPAPHRRLTENCSAARLGGSRLGAAAIDFLRCCPPDLPAAKLDLVLDIADDLHDRFRNELGALLHRPEVAAIHPRLRVAEARCCIEHGRVMEAERHLRETLARFPCHGPTYRLLGEVYLAQGRAKEAARAFDCAAAFWNRSWWLEEFPLRHASRIPGIVVDGNDIFYYRGIFSAVRVSPKWRRRRVEWLKRYVRWAVATAQKIAHSRGISTAQEPSQAKPRRRLLRRIINRAEFTMLRLRGGIKAPTLPELLDLLDEEALAGRPHHRR